MKVMISQPMGGKSKKEIDETFERAKAGLEEAGYEVVDTRFKFSEERLRELGVENTPLYYLAKSLETMSKVDAVFFCEGWKEARGCRVEYYAARYYYLLYCFESEVKYED